MPLKWIAAPLQMGTGHVQSGNCDWRVRTVCGTFRRVPRKIRQLVADLERAGFTVAPGGKGPHRKFRHAKVPGSLILSGQSGDDAKHYQEKQVRHAIRKASQ